MRAYLILGAAAGLALAQGAPLKEIDQLYLNRHQPGKLADAQQRAQSLLAAQPDTVELLWRLGRGWIAIAGTQSSKDEKLASLGKAEGLLRRATALAPGDVESRYWLARQMGGSNDILRTLKLAKAMKKELEAALELSKAHGGVHQLYGELMTQLPGFFGGSVKVGVEHLETALALSPNETGRYTALAQGYVEAKRKDDAVAALRKIFMVKQPDDPGAYEQDLKDARALLKKLTGSES